MVRKIKRGDTVEVVAGNDSGLRGTVRRVIPAREGTYKGRGRRSAFQDRVVVSGVNLVKKHQRPVSPSGAPRTQTGIIEFEAPVHLSNVMLVCPSCSQRVRVGFRFLDDGKKVRYCKKCDETIDK
ncbi:MAG: 50S ribosomal protein L24 [Chloroflexota bacterium]